MNKELSANAKLSQYRIIAKLGAGGMGEVYRARYTRLDREPSTQVLPAGMHLVRWHPENPKRSHTGGNERVRDRTFGHL